VLVLDDDAASLATSREALERAGYVVLALENALVLASTLRRRPVDLVLCETELSTVRGAVVLNALKEHGVSSAPVLLCSKLTGAALEARARECGAQGAFTKGDAEAVVAQVTARLGGPLQEP
jgi:DNA-binding response OmpR family regulator